MKGFLVAVISVAALSLQAAASPSGGDHLRELVVFPDILLTFHYGIGFQCGEWVVSKNTDPGTKISQLREELKRQPDTVEKLLQLGYLLDNNDETNESRVCYQKAEQLCRAKVATTPQDGLALTELGKTLWQLDKNEEAAAVYRKAVLISSNEWRCWAGLGNFLAIEPFPLMFPENLRNQTAPSPQAPAQELLDYHPPAEALKKAEASCAEASQCFDRAMALAPKEPEVFLQRAGFMSVSNWQNCFFRHYHDGEEIHSSQWPLNFFSQETVANLHKAADLNSKNYELISIAAYFEWYGALIQANWPTNYTVEMLPDKTRQSIRGAMTRLENLSENPHKQTAAGALENLGVLNMAFNNQDMARSDFRRAVSLDQTREQSWDLLLGTMLDSASPEEIVSVCESRLKYDGSAQNHLLLAKALTKEEKWNTAVKQAEIAGKIETNNVVPPLLIAAIALKQSAQTNCLTAAKIYMNRVNAMLPTIPDEGERVKRWREFMLNGAILSALNGQPGIAKDWAKEVLKNLPDDETAKEILAALQ